jgi:hypothetical protein
MKHYVYKLTDTKTGEYYFGSRSHENPSTDTYMGSMRVWKPENKLVKKILKDDFETRDNAIEYEALMIENHINDELNRNYYIPDKGFHTFGLDICSEKSFIKRYGEVEGLVRRKKWLDGIKASINKNMENMSDDEKAEKFGSPGESNPNYGNKWSDEWKEEHSKRMIEYYKLHNPPRLGAVHTEDTKLKLSISKKEYYKHNKNHRIGCKFTDEQKEKLRESLKTQPIETCPHCGITTIRGNIARWHLDKCKKLKK